ncbi:cytochrome P450 [Streptomyces sp. DvalAA-19]|uniref:cytochrome P450 n=1 Tax=Streptomyces sp. DvalAA-19 TaxID=1839761 RepID=UPI00081BC37E|nr:cytochrome P450 [Streptomyces sp. DvalAA-19]SCE09174.1 Cytochrome P450 [Streptomyces sp. DvalAA-19]
MSSPTRPTTPGTEPDFPGARSARCPFDPPQQHTEWRQSAGLQKVRLANGQTAWAVSRYEDAKHVLSDPRFSADGRRYPQLLNADDTSAPAAFPRMDDPEHARIRRTLTGEFTVRRIESMRPFVREVVHRFADEFAAAGPPNDLVTGYALPIPSLVISQLLGVPYEKDHELFQSCATTLQHMHSTTEQKKAAKRQLFTYLVELVERKQDQPGDDLISRLLEQYATTGELTPHMIAMNSMIILHAGHETTANMIGLGTLALLQNPDQADIIRDTDDPKTLATAVEELLRYLSIAQDMVLRVATEDLTIGGQAVKEGDMLTLNLPSANRDGIFRNADELDLHRHTRGHLAFGYGIHQCLGQALARVELQEALPAILRRLPNLKLAIPLEQVKFRSDMSAYGVHELPLTW